MAKTKQDLNFSDLAKKLDEFSECGSILSESQMTKIDDWIPTGNYTLNALISSDIFKGIPSGRITIFSGESQTGKTFLSLNAASQAQKLGYKIIWLDSENAIDPEKLPNFGIDLKTFRHELVNMVSEVNTYIKKLTNILLAAKKEGSTIPKIMIILDSLGNLSTDKEVNDSLSGSDKMDMTRSKEIKKMFRVLTIELAKLQIPMLIVNHTYAAVGSFIPMNIQGGGSGPAYLSSITVNLSKAQMKDTAGTKVGVTVSCKLDKARFTVPGYTKKIQIHFYKGMNPYIGLETFMSEKTFDELGYGPGKINKDGVYTYDAKELPSTFAIKDTRKNIKRNEFYSSKYFTPDKLEILNRLANNQLLYSNSQLVEIGGLVDEEEEDED